MATTASTWLMTEAQADGVMRGFYQRDIVGDTPYGVVDGTQRRDVSEMLDLLALADTPFINRIGWGPDSGGTSIEWISEDLGPGKLKTAAAIVSDCLSFAVNSIDGLDWTGLMRLLRLNRGRFFTITTLFWQPTVLPL